MDDPPVIGSRVLTGKLTSDQIADLYAAALEPDAHERIIGIAQRVLDADSVGLFLCRDDALFRLVATPDIVESIPAYFAHFYTIDPWGGGKYPHRNRAYASTEVVDEAALLKSEFYNDFAVDYGIRRPMGIVLDLEPGFTIGLSANRVATSRFFSTEDKPVLDELGFHVQASLRLHRHALRERTREAWQHSAFDALDFGIVVCAGNGEVVHANRAALQLSAERAGIAIDGRKVAIHAQRPQEAVPLASLIRSAACGTPGAMRLTGCNGVSLSVLATPLSREGTDRSQPGRLLLSLRRTDAGPSLAAGHLRQLFGLSPNQADLCLRLASGRTFEQAALEGGMAVATARAHFRAILSKTQARNLRDLLRLLSTLPQVRHAMDRT